MPLGRGGRFVNGGAVHRFAKESRTGYSIFFLLSLQIFRYFHEIKLLTQRASALRKGKRLFSSRTSFLRFLMHGNPNETKMQASFQFSQKYRTCSGKFANYSCYIPIVTDETLLRRLFKGYFLEARRLSNYPEPTFESSRDDLQKKIFFSFQRLARDHRVFEKCPLFGKIALDYIIKRLSLIHI